MASRESGCQIRGFTLIELLVVIAVIALLMGVLLPVLGRVRKQAQSVVCRAHLKHLGTAAAIHIDDNDGGFPIRPPVRGWDHVSLVWETYLEHIDNDGQQGSLLCPVAKQPVRSFPKRNIKDGVVWLHGGTFRSWWYAYPDMREVKGSYAYNFSLYRDWDKSRRAWDEMRIGTSLQLWRDDQHWSSPGKIRLPATVPMIIDSKWQEAWLNTTDRTDPPPVEDWDFLEHGHHLFSCINRHQGNVNGLFVDYSIRKVGLKELWTLKWHPKFDTANRWTLAGGVQPEDWPKWMRKFKDY